MESYVKPETLETNTRDWLKQIAPFNQHQMLLNKEKAALLVIDMQRFFLDPNSPTFTCGGLAILPTLKRLIAAFRAAGRPVIYTRHVHHPDRLDAGIMGWWWEGMCLEGSAESEVHADLAPLPNEKVILKHRYSTFYNTDLETILRCLKIEDLVISGIMTICVVNPPPVMLIIGIIGSSSWLTALAVSMKRCIWQVCSISLSDLHLSQPPTR